MNQSKAKNNNNKPFFIIIITSNFKEVLLVVLIFLRFQSQFQANTVNTRRYLDVDSTLCF